MLGIFFLFFNFPFAVDTTQTKSAIELNSIDPSDMDMQTISKINKNDYQ
jgi:hypothetical protein